MGNSLRCCLACILPCGALDLIRIVHINGEVEEYSRPVFAKEILDANPNHVISRPCSQSVSHRITIMSPNVELKRGNIYFLIPASALSEKKRKTMQKQKKSSQKASSSTSMKASLDQDFQNLETLLIDEKKRDRRQRKSDRGATWRPHLESIFED